MAEKVDIPDNEESQAAAVNLQRITRGNQDRELVRQLKNEAEAKRWDPLLDTKDSGWGYDRIRNVMLCNATTTETPRMMKPDQKYPMELAVADTVVETYEGETDERGLYNGEGKATFKNGHSYKGKWSQGLMHGNGTFSWKDGVSFKGPMVQGRISGRGQLKWPGGNVYDGQVVDGYRHGKGKFVMVMESDEVEDESAVLTYEGEWRCGKRNGSGALMYDSDGKQKYDGQWWNDTRHGFGTMSYKSGNIYKGEWKDGKLHGQGQMMWYSKNEVYVGEWKDGLQHGKGEHVWFMDVHPGTSFQTMNKYVGDWDLGRRKGFGVFEFADGSRYEGEWVDNLKEGMGTFTFPDGNFYKGKFEKDRMVDYKRPTKPPSNPGAGEVVIHINDLLAEQNHPQGELIKVKNLIVQYMSELKQIFRYYSQCSTEERIFKPITQAQEGTIIDNAFAMSMIDFWKFAKDCRIPDPRLTIAEIDRVFMRVDRNSQDRNELVDVHNPQKKLIYRHFLEGVIRLADFKYRDLATTSDRLCHALYHNILPYACHDIDDDFKMRSETVDVKHVTGVYEPHLRQLFSSWCKGGNTLSLRDCIELLREKKALGDKFGHSEVMEIYYRLQNIDNFSLEQNRTNADSEVIYEEFHDILLRLGDKQLPGTKPTPLHTRLADLFGILVPGITVGRQCCVMLCQCKGASDAEAAE